MGVPPLCDPLGVAVSHDDTMRRGPLQADAARLPVVGVVRRSAQSRSSGLTPASEQVYSAESLRFMPPGVSVRLISRSQE